MAIVCSVLLIICCSFVFIYGKTNQTNRRESLIHDEFKMSIGGNILLNENEMAANEVLMEWKKKELKDAFDNPQYFNFSRNYFEYRDDITFSNVYQFIKMMPKAALLHIHVTAALGPDFFLNVTYRDHLHVCLDEEIKFHFGYASPNESCVMKWRLMKEVRESVANVTKFDLELRNNFTLVGLKNLNVNSIWKRFSSIFNIVYPLWRHRPVWQEYFLEVLKQFKRDNIMYAEIRSSLPELYELDGTQHDELYFVFVTNEIVESFVRDNPDFLGVRMICSFNRHITPKRVEELLYVTTECKKRFPEFIAGFDLVGQEDKGGPLVNFLAELEAAKPGLDYFFHAGETNWYGTQSDENLIDAVMLGTKRIGHAYALSKHPFILEEVKKKDIGLEISVISNNVLDLVLDLRNHPLAAYISQGLPVVLSSDDPGFWEADILSTDFYVAFMGIASRLHDLRLLKQLALNSIRYSSLSELRKKNAYDKFNTKWDSFINDFVRNNVNNDKKSGYNYVYEKHNRTALRDRA